MKKRFEIEVTCYPETMQTPSALDIKNALFKGSGKWVDFKVTKLPDASGGTLGDSTYQESEFCECSNRMTIGNGNTDLLPCYYCHKLAKPKKKLQQLDYCKLAKNYKDPLTIGMILYKINEIIDKINKEV